LVLSAIISLLTGCNKSQPAAAPQTAAPPTGPGVSVVLNYPVLLIDERDVRVKDDQDQLITTTVASGGLYYASYVFIDSAGNQYSVNGATAFGRKSAWLDMGTSQFQAFIELTPRGKIELEKAKEMALDAIFKPGDRDADAREAVKAKVDGAASFPELIEICKGL
jgi:hypothetical protein